MPVPRETVEQLADRLDLYHYIQPENSEAERERFTDAVADGRTYHPSYRYPDFDGQEAEELLDTARSAAETELEQRMVQSLDGRLRMIAAIGSAEITRRSREHYGAPGEALVRAARQQFSPPAAPGEGGVEGGQLKAAFDALFDALDVSYSCELDGVDIIRNSPQERRVLVPREKTYTAEAARRLLVHESTHSVRTVNGEAAGKLPLVHGTAGYETAEEGLATFNEQEIGVFQETVPRITARVIAVDAAGKPFHDLYEEMKELGLDDRAAYIRTYRVKRGLKDTSQPGGFIKDHIYFQGYHRLAQDPAAAEPLYTGKIGFDDVDVVDVAAGVERDEHIAACRTVAGEYLR